MAVLQGVLDTPRRISIAVLGFVISPLLLSIAHSVNHLQQNAQLEMRVQHASSNIRARIGSIQELMTSLVSLYQVAGTIESQKLLLIAENQGGFADYITSMGRFDRVSAEDRHYFETYMTESGFPGFQISRVDDHARYIGRSEADWYYPVTLLEPLEPQSTRLLGADLSSFKGAGTRP